MRTINQMVIQPNIPNDNRVLWLNRNNASYYNNGTWVTIGESSEDRQKLKEKVVIFMLALILVILSIIMGLLKLQF